MSHGRIKIPRLSLYKPEKGNDYRFIDRQISEMFQVGGTDVYLHKYMGPIDPTDSSKGLGEATIQDVVFLENRDRKYDAEIYKLRGIYNVQNIDFNLSQFGLFIDNDTLYMTVHINDFVKFIGRKPISGDVIELPHLKDEFALNDYEFSLPRYYVIEDVGRASEGFSSTWFPHLYRLKLKKLQGAQQYTDIFNKPTGADAEKFAGDYITGDTYYPGQIVRINGALYQVKTDGTVLNTGTTLTPPNSVAWNLYVGSTLEDLLTTRAKELQINDSILLEADGDTNTAHPYDGSAAPVGKSGYETSQFYTLAVDANGRPLLNTADTQDLIASGSISVAENNSRPIRTGYLGYLVGDGLPVNGYSFGHGTQFPELPSNDDFFLRTDFLPNRLFRFDNTRWIKVEDNVRMALTNTDTRYTQKTSFINNTSYIYDSAIAIDYVRLEKDATIINCDDIDFVIPIYVVLKLEGTEIAFTVAEHASIITNNNGKVRITLPTINNVQQVIPYTGTWKISLCNNREAQRQSLSKALKPKADL